MSQVIRIPSEIYSRLEFHAEGFDSPANVIEKLLNYYEGISQPLSEKSSKKDYTKYSFNHNYYGKGRLVLAIVKEYVFNNPDISFDKLLTIFPKHLQGSIGVFNQKEYVLKKYAEKNHPKHFIKPNELIQLSDCVIAVCTEWGAGNIDGLIQQGKKIGYAISASKN